MRVFFLIALCLFYRAPVSKAEDMTESVGGGREEGISWQWFGHYSKDPMKFSNESGDANFSVSSIGAGLVQKLVTKRGAGFAIRGEFAVRKGDNTANTLVVGTTESMTGTIFIFGARYYALNAFLGLSGSFMPFTINFMSATRSVERKYTGYGFGIEAGVDLFLGRSLFITPKVEYQMFSAQPGTGATDAERVSSINLGMSLGLAF